MSCPLWKVVPTTKEFFFFLNRVYRIGARAEPLEMLEGRWRIIIFSFLPFPLKCSASLQDNWDSIGLEFAPILVSSGGLGLHDYLEQIRKWHPDSRGTQPHSAVQCSETGAQAECVALSPLSWSPDTAHVPSSWMRHTCAQGTHLSPSGLLWRRGRTWMLHRGKIWTNSDSIYSPDRIHYLSLALVCL